jgi:hypothetical protein
VPYILHLLGGHHSPPHACHNALVAQPDRSMLQGRQVHLAARVGGQVGGRWAVATTAPGASHKLDPYTADLVSAAYLVQQVHCSRGCPSPSLRWLPHQSTQLALPRLNGGVGDAVGARPQRARFSRGQIDGPRAAPRAWRAASLQFWAIRAYASGCVHNTANLGRD